MKSLFVAPSIHYNVGCTDWWKDKAKEKTNIFLNDHGYEVTVCIGISFSLYNTFNIGLTILYSSPSGSFMIKGGWGPFLLLSL